MKRILCFLFSLSSGISCAAVLTQAEFNQQLALHTQTINKTKLVLEGDNASQDAEVQKKAFCSRLKAYRAIAKLAVENPSLDQAYLMGVIANRYLDRQKQSMNSAGMTEQYFCPTLNAEINPTKNSKK